MLEIKSLGKTYGTRREGDARDRRTCRSRSRTGEFVCVVGPVRLREDDAAEVHRRPPAADARRGAAARPPVDGAAGGDGARLPGVQPLADAVDVGPEQRAAAAPAQEARALPSGRGSSRSRSRRSGSTRFIDHYPVAALGRDAAARRDRAGARLPALDPAHGRAVRLGRRPDPRRPRGSRAAGAGGVRDHDPLRHARHRRVGLPLRPHRRADARPDGGEGDHPGRAAVPPRPDRDEGAAGLRAPASARLPADQARAGPDAAARRGRRV